MFDWTLSGFASILLRVRNFPKAEDFIVEVFCTSINRNAVNEASMKINKQKSTQKRLRQPRDYCLSSKMQNAPMSIAAPLEIFNLLDSFEWFKLFPSLARVINLRNWVTMDCTKQKPKQFATVLMMFSIEIYDHQHATTIARSFLYIFFASTKTVGRVQLTYRPRTKEAFHWWTFKIHHRKLIFAIKFCVIFSRVKRKFLVGR